MHNHHLVGDVVDGSLEIIVDSSLLGLSLVCSVCGCNRNQGICKRISVRFQCNEIVLNRGGKAGRSERELLGLECLDGGLDVTGEVLDRSNDAVGIGRRDLGCCLSIACTLVDGLVQCTLSVLNWNGTENPTIVAVDGGGQSSDTGVNGGDVTENGGSISSPNGKC